MRNGRPPNPETLCTCSHPAKEHKANGLDCLSGACECEVFKRDPARPLRRKQTRRSISVSKKTYDRLVIASRDREASMSSLVEAALRKGLESDG